MARKTFAQLKQAIRASGVAIYRVEERIGMGRSELSRMFNGDPGALASAEFTEKVLSATKAGE